MRIGIDLMGSDQLPSILLDLIVRSQLPATFVFFGTSEVLSALPVKKEFEPFPCSQVIGMEDSPVESVRSLKDSSLVQGLKTLKKGGIDAFVTAGNTGALIAASSLILSKIPGVIRPALLAVLPTEKGQMSVLDVGGSVASKASHLVQFAFMGSIYHQIAHPGRKPRVALLNVGVESKKGHAEVQKAYLELNKPQKRFDFVGNVEARDLFNGDIDVLVTDGFSGNIFLKTAEGVAHFILKNLGPQVQPTIQKTFSYAEYPGAIVCGVNGIVVKCHGEALPQAFLNSVKGAIQLTKNSLVDELKSFSAESN